MLKCQNVGNFSDETATATTGSWSTWSLDFDRHQKHSRFVSVDKIVDIPSAGFLNGMTAVPSVPGILLTADSDDGLIYRIDALSKTWSVFLNDPTLKPNLTAPVKLGVNGVHVRDGYLYFDNSFQSPLLARVPYHIENATAAGPVEVIFESAAFPLNEGRGQADDFAFDQAGNIWLSSASSSVVKLGLEKHTQTLVAGGPDDPVLVGSTSVAFGRRREDRDVLYITTNGGISDPSVAGLTGGQVAALNTKWP
jgi:sugar lactone lactonase YvrE